MKFHTHTHNINNSLSLVTKCYIKYNIRFDVFIRKPFVFFWGQLDEELIWQPNEDLLQYF